MVAEAHSGEALDVLRHSSIRIAPEFALIEVGTALSRREQLGEIPIGQAQSDMISLPLYFTELTAAAGLVAAGMQLSLTLRHPFTDCIYLALAQQRALKLLTADLEFTSKLLGTPHAADVMLLSDWLG